jgi:hypothetical protein
VDLKIDGWLDDESPGQSEIEATAGALAIEHTSIDMLPQQGRIEDQTWCVEAEGERGDRYDFRTRERPRRTRVPRATAPSV